MIQWSQGGSETPESVALILQNGGSQSPDRWLWEGRNNQRIENTSKGEWNYIIITDEGRLPPMRKTARAIRAYNPVQSHFGGVQNIPIKGLIEDVLAKESEESYFIQLCDFVSFFADLYYRCEDKGETLPKRVEKIVDRTFVKRVFVTLKAGDVLNLKASNNHDYGFVIYPR